jgi:hypothetical protein
LLFRVKGELDMATTIFNGTIATNATFVNNSPVVTFEIPEGGSQIPSSHSIIKSVTFKIYIKTISGFTQAHQFTFYT